MPSQMPSIRRRSRRKPVYQQKQTAPQRSYYCASRSHWATSPFSINFKCILDHEPAHCKFAVGRIWFGTATDHGCETRKNRHTLPHSVPHWLNSFSLFRYDVLFTGDFTVIWRAFRVFPRDSGFRSNCASGESTACLFILFCFPRPWSIPWLKRNLCKCHDELHNLNHGKLIQKITFLWRCKVSTDFIQSNSILYV